MQNRNFMLEGVVEFFLSFVDILEIFHLLYHINVVNFHISSNYKMTNSIFSMLTFNFMNEQMHISGCHFN